jgi:hypothetical protein
MTIQKRLSFPPSWILSFLATFLIVVPTVQAEEVSVKAAREDQPQLIAGDFAVTLDGGMLNNNLSELFNRAFNHNTGSFHDINDILGQVNNIFGARTFPGSYLDNQISRDAKLVGTLYHYFLNQEMKKPSIATRDLPNPFNTSIQEDPSYLNPR